MAQNIVSSSTRPSDRLRPINPQKHPSRFLEIISAIAQTESMIILSGDVALSNTGLLPLDVPIPINHSQADPRHITLNSLLRDCDPSIVRPENLPASKLALLNSTMAHRRILARRAKSNTFLDFLKRISDENRLKFCVTTSFDGLEAESTASLADKAIMLRGDNRVLRCCSRGCETMSVEGTKLLDMIMSNSGTALCPGCIKKNVKTAKARRTGNDATRALRPAVQDSVTQSMMLSEEVGLLQQAAGTCQLLLIVGTPLKSAELLQLARDLASAIHQAYGAVILIDSEVIQGSNQYDHIDIHLQCDIQEGLGQVMQEMNRSPVNLNITTSRQADDNDLWFNAINNEIPRRVVPQEDSYLGPVCFHCSCGIRDYLVQCKNCRVNFCYRRIEENSLEETRVAQQPLDGEQSDREDDFPFYEACIVFNMFSRNLPPPSLSQAKDDFVCFNCWDHSKLGHYPHFVRPIAREKIESTDLPWPRLALLVYYIDQFWPQAKHFCTAISSLWKQMGWQCVIEPVKLEHINEKEKVFVDLSWEHGTYELIAVYITHGLTGEKGYQLTPTEALHPQQFLQKTLSIANRPLEEARSKRVFLLCCGHPLLNPEFVGDLQDWIASEGIIDTVIGCLNVKFSPAYMVNLIAKLSKALVESTTEAYKIIHHTWMRDTIACSHTDLLCLTKTRPPEMWLYAPFSSRPLGKALPSLLSVCPCTAKPHDGQDTRSKRRRKIWKVEHDGRPGSKLRDVKVKAICQACRQTWPLPQESLVGKLVKINGVYGVVLPYFYEDVEE
ncbi:Hydrocephalus-inducing protein [Ceratobasidium theobromae]|uniref:Hydrocephalus-inducing protein n=1 Tax=Ceratobasidium theobromae TaxID=1582974 RepID=A0A5N5QCC7_9AGAM|nr:Hydrocephalus-inducing protein [Ceratobasidium theobromae]